MNLFSFPRFVIVAALALGVLVPAAAPASAGTVTDASAEQVLSVRGAGPYRIGARLQTLQEAGLIGWVAPPQECDVVLTGVTGDWSGVLILGFRAGRLVEVGTATVPPRSPAGASVGMSWDQLEDIYGRRGRLIHNNNGNQAYVVRIGSRVELYTDHPIRDGVGYFQAGPADFVLRNFLGRPVC
ncbi:hypothetical protein [Paractinoplanes rishiriensis]|nr:hypothetical protein [Actinoplanes rishiriensis]